MATGPLIPEGGKGKYTLAEAKSELDRQACMYGGHDFEVVVAMGNSDPQSIVCTRCGKSWPVQSA